MTALFFVDSNVLIYCHDSASPAKQARAQQWIDHLWRYRRGAKATAPALQQTVGQEFRSLEAWLTAE